MKKYPVKAVIRVWTATVVVIAWIGVCPAWYPYFTTPFSAGSAVQLKDDHGANGWAAPDVIWMLVWTDKPAELSVSRTEHLWLHPVVAGFVPARRNWWLSGHFRASCAELVQPAFLMMLGLCIWPIEGRAGGPQVCLHPSVPIS